MQYNCRMLYKYIDNYNNSNKTNDTIKYFYKIVPMY